MPAHRMLKRKIKSHLNQLLPPNRIHQHHPGGNAEQPSRHSPLAHPECSDAHNGPSAPRAAVPRATGSARRSTFGHDKTSPNDLDNVHACAHGSNKLRYIGQALCRLPFTRRPPAVSTCPHLCHSNAACLRLQAVARPDLPGHAPLPTGARTRRARPILIRNAEHRVPSCLRHA